jgi:hypothetical protein
MPGHRSSATGRDTFWLSATVADPSFVDQTYRYFVTQLIKSKPIVNIDTFHLSGR